MPQYPKIQQGAGLLRPRQAVMWAQQKKDDKTVAIVEEGALE
jgi:hypothetical protein